MTVEDQEKSVLMLSADLWNSFLALPDSAQDDIDDIRFHIHAVQAIIGTRVAKRVRPDLFKIAQSAASGGGDLTTTGAPS